MLRIVLMTLYVMNILYYTLFSIEYILAKAGLKLIDASINDINGGSIARLQLTLILVSLIIPLI